MSDTPPVKIPRVGKPARATKIAPIALVFGVAGVAVFAGLASSRIEKEEQSAALPPLRVAATQAPAPPPPAAVAPTMPPAVPLSSVQGRISAPPAPVQQPSYTPMPPVVRSPPVDQRAAERERERARVTAPALIVDMSEVRTDEPLPITSAVLRTSGGGPHRYLVLASARQSDPTGAAIAAAGPPPIAQAPAMVAPVLAPVVTAPEDRDLNANERFASRAGKRETDVAKAELLPNQHALVPQGTIIGAVMETALNSDVPGFARAVVTRDVLSFDGSQVLIPAGSHAIGEYNSGVAQGASRIFIIWNRLITPDGVSIALASPAIDELGRGGLGGKVNRHFFQRFGGAVLLSVLTGGINAFTQSRSRGSTVIVSSTNEATSLAGQASRGTDIPPTITTRQGATVRIFVAKDLDFSPVGASI
jgi:type IV secretion system protein VirB10